MDICQVCGFSKQDITNDVYRMLFISQDDSGSCVCSHCYNEEYDDARFTLEQYKGTHIFIKDLTGNHVFTVNTEDIEDYDLDIYEDELYFKVYNKYYDVLDDLGLIDIGGR